MVDLSLVLDVSSSIGSRWPAVRDAARTFVDAFDANNDRLSLVTYGNGASVRRRRCRRSRGFDKATVDDRHSQRLPGGSTAMVEGLYRGWDELRTVPAGQQSGLRVIVLFTDGASNSVPGDYPAQSGVARRAANVRLPEEPARSRTTRRTTTRRSTGCSHRNGRAEPRRTACTAAAGTRTSTRSRRCRACR